MLADFPNSDNHMILLIPHIISYVIVEISSDVNTQTSQSFLLIFCFDVFLHVYIPSKSFYRLDKVLEVADTGKAERPGPVGRQDEFVGLVIKKSKRNDVHFRTRTYELNNDY